MNTDTLRNFVDAVTPMLLNMDTGRDAVAHAMAGLQPHEQRAYVAAAAHIAATTATLATRMKETSDH